MRLRLWSAFAAVYVIWGSTYLAIRYAIETLPPFIMAGSRFIIAGSILYAWGRWRSRSSADAVRWRPAAISGALLLLGGNGSVVWAEQRVPSGLAALLIATEPLWVVLLDWLRPDGRKPRKHVAAGLILGFAGMVLLVGPGPLNGAGAVDPIGAAVLSFGAFSWALGSLYSMRTRISGSAMLTSGGQMLSGGVLLLAAGWLNGESGRLMVGQLSTRSIVALFYLIVFGSLVGFTSYSWLLKTTTASRASTYAYVNPIVAVLLGWLLAGEPISLRTIASAAVIISSVLLIVRYGKRE